MSTSAIGGFLIYACVNAFTPGPGNILALNTVTMYGWRRGRPLFLGIFAGYYVVQIICALLVYGAAMLHPAVLAGMRYAGAAYMLWLAVHILRSRPDDGAEGRSASFWEGFMLQFVNVKIYLFGITALTGYVTATSTALGVLVLVELFIATIGTIATLSWIGAGMAMRRVYMDHYRLVNAVLAAVLLECVVTMLVS